MITPLPPEEYQAQTQALLARGFTPAQAQAVLAEEPRILVAAAAGSGKTRVLVERIVNQVLSGRADLANICVVTFTNAAAAEMRSRLNQALRQAAAQADPADAQRLAAQRSALATAQIGTVHHFCQSIINRYYLQAGLEPGLRVLDAVSTQQLLQLALDDAMAELYEQNHPDFLAFVDAFSQKWSDDTPRKQTIGLYQRLRAQPDWQAWLQDAVEGFVAAGQDFAASAFMPPLVQRTCQVLSYARDCLQFAMQICQPYMDQPPSHLQKDDQALAAAQQAPKDSLQALGCLLDGLKKTRKTDLGVPAEIQQAVDDACTQAWDAVSKLKDKIKGLSADTHTAMGPALRGQAALLNALHTAYSRRKIAAGGLDFEDLEHGCLAALRCPQVAEECRAQYTRVLVDEYQDINPLQEEILNTLAADGQLFAVGDIKQAIYGFRCGDPRLFAHKMQTYATQPGQGTLLIHLDCNFRSTPALLQGINHLFADFMQAQTLQIDYDQHQALTPGQQERPAYPIEVCWLHPAQADEEAIDPDTLPPEALEQLEDPPEDDPPEQPDQPTSQSLLDLMQQGRAAAQMLLQWQQQPLHTPQGDRPMQWRDAAILLRAPNGGVDSGVVGRGALYAMALQQAGIPCQVGTTDSLLGADNQLLVELCRYVDNPQREWPLVSLLLSPLFDFTLDELITARMTGGRGGLVQALQARSRQTDDLGVRLAGFFAQILAWQQLAQLCRPSQWLWQVVQATGYEAVLMAMPDGENRVNNLHRLLALVQQYDEQDPIGGLHGLLAYLEHVESKPSAAEVAVGRDVPDVVRILSVHKSKGLEFACVIVAEAGGPMQGRGGSAALYSNPYLGIAPAYRDAPLRLKGSTPGFVALQIQNQADDLAEEARILYVALTRAQERLGILGLTPPKALRHGCLPNTPAVAGQAGCWLQWLAMGLARHPDTAAAFGCTPPQQPMPGRFALTVGGQPARGGHRPQKVNVIDQLRSWLQDPPQTDLPAEALTGAASWAGAARLPAKQTVTGWLQQAAGQPTPQAPAGPDAPPPPETPPLEPPALGAWAPPEAPVPEPLPIQPDAPMAAPDGPEFLPIPPDAPLSPPPPQGDYDDLWPEPAALAGVLPEQPAAAADPPALLDLEQGRHTAAQTARLRGTACHRLLQAMQLPVVAAGGLQQEIDRLVQAEILSTAAVALLPMQGLHWLANSRLLAAMAQAQQGRVVALEDLLQTVCPKGHLPGVQAGRLQAQQAFAQAAVAPGQADKPYDPAFGLLREQGFSLRLPHPQPGGQRVYTLLQGVMDALFDTPQGLVVCDYKLSRRPEDQLAAAYAPQLWAYAAAAQALCGRPVAACLLVDLNRGSVFSL